MALDAQQKATRARAARRVTCASSSSPPKTSGASTKTFLGHCVGRRDFRRGRITGVFYGRESQWHFAVWLLIPPWRGGYSLAWGFNPRWTDGAASPARLGLKPIGLHTSLPALEGGIFTSLGFQPQVGWRGGHWWSVPAVRAPSRLGLKPQAVQYPPLQGGGRDKPRP